MALSGRGWLAVAGLTVVTAAGCAESHGQRLTVGLPTTVQDSGLIDEILAAFSRAHPEYRVRYITGGSGELLAFGTRGDLDVLIAHSPAEETEFVRAGHGVERLPVMENDFVIVGPAADPAAVRGLTDAGVALARISEGELPFVSRGDHSGTHRKELELRETVGVSPGGRFYREAGQGMGEVLYMASELRAYTLCDRATFLNLAGSVDLELLLEGDPQLLNPYSVIPVTRAREMAAAKVFVDWITSDAGQRVIADYGVERFGQPLFRPARANLEPGNRAARGPTS